VRKASSYSGSGQVDAAGTAKTIRSSCPDTARSSSASSFAPSSAPRKGQRTRDRLARPRAERDHERVVVEDLRVVERDGLGVGVDARERALA